MTRTPTEAVRWTERRGDIPGGAGWCKRETRSAYDVPSDGSSDATEAWGRTRFRHTNGTTPPFGAVCWWTGGRNNHGHVAISLGDGRIRSTDLPRSGRWGTVSRQDPARLWGLQYVGWSEDIDGVRVITIPTPPPAKPKPKPRPPSRLAKLRAQLQRIAADPNVGKARRARAAAAARLLGGFR